MPVPVTAATLPALMPKAAIAFRGYNVTNLGKTPELLRHPVYGPIVERHLGHASEICSAALQRNINLVSRVRRRATSTLQSYPQDIATIMSIELAHIAILEECFQVKLTDAQLACGYSLGEATAVVATGVFALESVLTPLLILAKDCAALAHDVSMGVLFSRGRLLDTRAVNRLCLQITNRGKGTIAVSTFLSPNTVLLMGQRDTVKTFKKEMHTVLPEDVHLRRNPHRWPPIHTPISRQRNIPSRAAVMLETVSGGFTVPKPPIVSCVTGDADYDDMNSRDILTKWTDHPQQLWDVIDHILGEGVETVLHVGPEPNLFPATLTRLSNNIMLQLSGRSFSSMGKRAISRIARRRPWLTRLISNDAALLRAPFVEQVMLEDWLLENDQNISR